MKEKVTPLKVQVQIQATPEELWPLWTKPEHIVHWYFANPQWHCPRAESNLKEGGHFSYRMEAKDGSMGFDFSGIFDKIHMAKEIHFHLNDGRQVHLHFSPTHDKSTLLVEEFEAESSSPMELQQQGWQNILNQFKLYAESLLL